MAVRRILFVMLHPGFIRYYEDAILSLADAGHDVHLAFEISRTKLGEATAARQLAERSPRITCDVAPARPESVRTFLSRADRTATRSGGGARPFFSRAGRAEAWESLATTIRLVLDYLRYFDPAFARSDALRNRAAKRLPRIYRGVTRLMGRAGASRSVMAASLSGLERVIPPNADVETFIRGQQPDLLLVTPLIELGSQQVDYVKSARRLGIRSALCVASWDNLTSKGLIRVVPDHVVVWNEAQKQEAVALHGVEPGRVVVTGAQLFDRWFDAHPSRSREEFCRLAGVDPARPVVIYLGSSTFIAPDEVPFVERWLRSLRAAKDPAVATAGVLIRPHPANEDQWRAFDPSLWPGVSVWPAPGSDPVRPDARRDYADSLFHSAAVVGINTSAQIEAGIIGRPVLTVRAPEFAHAQAGTLHFQHLVQPGEALVQSATSLAEHVGQLSAALADPDAGRAAAQRFLGAFVRPRGLDRPAVPVFVGEVERLAGLPPPPAEPDSPAMRAARGPALLAAWVARTLADDRPLWVYALRPFVTTAVWIWAVLWMARDRWHDRGYPFVKRASRAAGRAAHDARKRLTRWLRRVRKPIGAIVRGAARHLAGRNA